MATQTVQATNTAPKKKIKIAPIVCFIVTVILAVLFIYPVYFAVISAFKSNGEILKAPLAFPTELYLQNFKDLFGRPPCRSPGGPRQSRTYTAGRRWSLSQSRGLRPS